MREPSRFSKSDSTRELNFAGAYGCRLGYRLAPQHTTSIDIAIAHKDNAGCAALCWSTAPSFLDSLQVHAHLQGCASLSRLPFPRLPLPVSLLLTPLFLDSLHLTPVGLFKVDAIGWPSGLVPTMTQEDVFLAIQLPYIRSSMSLSLFLCLRWIVDDLRCPHSSGEAAFRHVSSAASHHGRPIYQSSTILQWRFLWLRRRVF